MDDTVRKRTYNIYNYGSETTDITLSVGYINPDDYPKALKEVALEIIDLMYYEHETGKSYTKDLTQLSKDTIDSYRRFYI